MQEDRLAFSLLNLFGRDVQVTKTNGCRLDGVFCAASGDKSGFSLRYCKHVEGEKPEVAFQYRDRVRVAWDDVETLVALHSGGAEGHSFDPALVAASQPPKKRTTTVTSVVGTDSSIAAKSAAAAPRAELQAVDPQWLTAAAAPKEKDNGAPWDQFETNRAKFNVPNTFKPDMYTTELRREDFTAEQLKRAQELERGIESKSAAASSNAHVREERGQATEGDEEDRFGAVNKKPATGSWASMVKGNTVVSSPPSKPAVASSKPAPATTTAAKRSAPATAAVTSSKKREEEIREFKEFSQTYQSPSAGPKTRKGTPPPSLALDQQQPPEEPVAPAPPVEKKKFTLNANAKKFTPTLPPPVVLQQQPPPRMGMPPMHHHMAPPPHPGYYPPPPPPYYAGPPPSYYMYPPRYFPPPPQYAMYPPPPPVPIPPPHPETYAAAQQAANSEPE